MIGIFYWYHWEGNRTWQGLKFSRRKINKNVARRSFEHRNYFFFAIKKERLSNSSSASISWWSNRALRAFSRFWIRSEEVALGRRWLPVCNWTNTCWKRVSSLTMQRMNDQMLACARSRRRFSRLWKPERVHAENTSNKIVDTHLHMCYLFDDRNHEYSIFSMESCSSNIHRNTEIIDVTVSSPLYSVWHVSDKRKFRLRQAAAEVKPSICDSNFWFPRLQRKTWISPVLEYDDK